jgi:dTMP kinase
LKRRGIFITLEGIDGTGKSTQQRLLVQHLREQGHRTVATREPGGTRLGERIRQILLNSDSVKVAPLAELVLMYAARAQHLEEVVRPALARGEVVVSDRFNDASLAYQGFGRGLGAAAVRSLDRAICGRTQPDLTLVLDLPARLARARAQGRKINRRGSRERFEIEGIKFHERVRGGYVAIARQEPARVKIIPAGGTAAEVQAEIRSLVDRFLQRRGRLPRTRT